MTKLIYTLLLLVSGICSFIFVSIPSLSYYYTPQVIAVLILLVLFFHQLYTKKGVVILKGVRVELPLLGAIFLILVGTTGSTASLLYPLVFVHLFLLLIVLDTINAITSSFLITLFHLLITPIENEQQLASLLSIPVLTLLFLFTKKQLEQRFLEKQILEKRENQIAKEQTAAGFFITTFLRPKLEALSHLAQYPEANKDVICKQIEILQEEANQVVEQMQ